MSEMRALAPDEVDTLVDWAANEGWNPGLADAEAFLAQDEAGILGLFDKGELVSCISAVTYEETFGFVGLYICRQDRRGRGLGLEIWNAGLARLDGRSVGLDGVLAQQDNYRASGFVLAHRNIRYGGAPKNLPGAQGVVPVERLDLPGLFAFDQRHFGFHRPRFLERWLRPQEGAAFVAHGADGAISGYGVVRRCRSGHKIGPLFADDEDTARALYAALSTVAFTAARDEPLFLDVPEPNAAARTLAEDAGLTPVFETARMYRGDAPALPLPHIYGITTFELG